MNIQLLLVTCLVPALSGCSDSDEPATDPVGGAMSEDANNTTNGSGDGMTVDGNNEVSGSMTSPSRDVALEVNVVEWTDTGDENNDTVTIRLISARDATKREIAHYQG